MRGICDGCGRDSGFYRLHCIIDGRYLCHQCFKKRQEEKVPLRREALKIGRKMRREKGRICQGCRREIALKALDLHHKTPLSLGGTNDPENLTLLCKDCHAEAHRQIQRDLTQ